MAKRLRSADLPPPANHLLAALSSEVFDRIATSLDVVPLTLKQIVHKPGERIRDIYFPGGGFISIVTVLNDGSMVEVATVGPRDCSARRRFSTAPRRSQQRWCRLRPTPATECRPMCSARR